MSQDSQNSQQAISRRCQVQLPLSESPLSLSGPPGWVLQNPIDAGFPYHSTHGIQHKCTSSCQELVVVSPCWKRKVAKESLSQVAKVVQMVRMSRLREF